MARNIQRRVSHLKSNVVENNAPKLISSDDLGYGEIAINYAKDLETITLKNASNEVITFSADASENKNKAKHNVFANTVNVSGATTNVTGKTKLNLSGATITANATDVNVKGKVNVTGDVTVSSAVTSKTMSAETLTLTTTGSSVPTAPLNDSGKTIANTEFVLREILAKLAENDAMLYKTTISAKQVGAGNFPSTYEKGWTYKVAAPFEWGDSNPFTLEPGDILIANKDVTSPVSSVIEADWDAIQVNIDGAVVSDASASTADSVVVFKSANGRKVGEAKVNGSVVSVSTLASTGNKITSDGVISLSNSGDLVGANQTKEFKITHNNSTNGGSKSITGSTNTSKQFGGTFTVPSATTDQYGHISAVGTYTVTNPSVAGSEEIIVTTGTTGATWSHSAHTAGTASGSNGQKGNGDTIDIPTVTWNGYGHVTGSGKTTVTLPNYTGSDGITVTGTTVKHSNSITAGQTSPNTAQTPGYGETFNIPVVKYDAQGHITGTTTTTVKIPASDQSDTYITGLSNSSNETGNTITATRNDSQTITTTLPSATQSAAGLMSKTDKTNLDNAVPKTRKVSTASGLTGGGDLTTDRTIGLIPTGSPGTYGPSADVTGNEGTTIKVPQITTDVYGRVTSVTERTYTSKDTTYNAVTSVAGKTGAVTLTKSDVGLGSVDNTADANKKVASAATAAVAESVALSNVSGADDLKAIEALTGTSGLLKKTAANTWSLDTSTYLTGITKSQVTTALGYTPPTDDTTYAAGHAISITGTTNSINFTLPISAGTGTNALIYNDASNVASSLYSHAEGNSTTAMSESSHAEGHTTKANGFASHSEGSGTKAIGNYSHTEGCDTIATNDGMGAHAEGNSTSATSSDAHAEGYYTLASGVNSHAEGDRTIASGAGSHAEGQSTSATSNTSHAEGSGTTASGTSSHAEGNGTTASGGYSHAEGDRTTASGDYSHAEGQSTTASGQYSHAEGDMTKASGNCSHAEGDGTTASGHYSHAEGYQTTATSDSSHAEGDNTTASGTSSHAEGYYTKASGYSSHAEGEGTTASGSSSHAEGFYTIASGPSSHAEGEGTTASGSLSHAEGEITRASGLRSHAEGSGTTASGDDSHAEGRNTVASGSSSHAEGYYAHANGAYCHAEGGGTTASGYYSHAEGSETVASGYSSHAEGEYTTASGNWSHAEGYQTTAMGESSHAEGDSTTARGHYSHAEGVSTTASGTRAHAEGQSTSATSDSSHAEGDSTIASGYGSHAEGDGTYAEGDYSHAEGNGTTAMSESSHAEGSYTIASGDYSHAEGDRTTASGDRSHAEGSETLASAILSHAEGNLTTANGENSHSEGSGTTASGSCAHSEGMGTTAVNHYSHTEGCFTKANGLYSHAEGRDTIANNQSEHASGQYNVSSKSSDTFGDAGNTLFSVGNGTDNSNRKNAFEIRQNGDVIIQGSTTGTNFYITSDLSKKENVSTVSEHIRKFTLKSNQKEYYGVIAQEVDEMFREGEEGNMSVNYNSLYGYYISLLENKIKELEDRIIVLENGK